jgi:hypothetical protein
MREIDWQTKDKNEIIGLVIKNCSVSTLTAEQERRIRGKLENMSAAELWRHIEVKYNNKLYDDDLPFTVDGFELRRREKAMAQVIKRPPVVKTFSAPPPAYKPPPIDEAENELFGKQCVKRVFHYGDTLAVVMEDVTMKEKLGRWCKKHYPSVKVEIL